MSTLNWVYNCFLIILIARLNLIRGIKTSLYSDQQSNEQQQLDRVLKLPGQNFNVSFEHYAGYVTLFAGPGCSSIGYGLAEEIGPFHVEKDGKTLYLNPYSWTKAANILFLDSPVGVGYSYSNTSSDILSNGDIRTAAENLEFLLRWFERFPQYRGRDFYLSGESYAGHYVPQLSQAIVKHNRKNGEEIINFKGFIIGNALIDDFHDHLGQFQYMWSIGMISDQTFKQLNIYCDFQPFAHASESCNRVLRIALKEIGDIDWYSIFTPPCKANFSRINPLWRRKNRAGLLRIPYDPCTEQHSTVYFNLPEVQSALHVHINDSSLKWKVCNHVVSKNWKDSPKSVLNIFRELLHSGLRIWIFRFFLFHHNISLFICQFRMLYASRILYFAQKNKPHK
ncbi:hypothetical protein ACJIZ3_020693 [Penstemon smallii]|uniref:Carboxypeptidase n=1 Tax=Penstemon smallii TaxID=265156 RepID=A0ABD3SJC9_9LAMI